jgi:hypothetical protein
MYLVLFCQPGLNKRKFTEDFYFGLMKIQLTETRRVNNNTANNRGVSYGISGFEMDTRTVSGT